MRCRAEPSLKAVRVGAGLCQSIVVHIHLQLKAGRVRQALADSRWSHIT